MLYINVIYGDIVVLPVVTPRNHIIGVILRFPTTILYDNLRVCKFLHLSLL